MRRSSGSRAVVALVLALVALALAAAIAVEAALRNAGRADLSVWRPVDLPYVGLVLLAFGVGAVLALRRPEHPVGWLFLALAGSIAVSGALDGYARYGVVARPGSLPLAEAAAVVSGGMFIVWFVLLAQVLHLTPTGRPLSPRWGRAATATTVAGGLGYACHLVWPVNLDPPFVDLVAWELPGSSTDVVAALTMSLMVGAAVGLVVGAASLLVRFRRAAGDERRQLLWLVIGVVPSPAFLALAFYASPDHPLLLAFAVSGFMGLIPVTAALAIVQYHLYDVERILSRALTYLLVSALLAGTFLLVVVVAGHALGGRLGDSSFPAVVATLAAVAVAGPAYQGFQEAIDRRFRRRRYDALRQVGAFLADPARGEVRELLQSALGDPSITVAYWIEDDEGWADAEGRAVAPSTDDLVVTRQDRPVARVSCDAATDRDLARAVVDAALPELESAMLRARISRQLVEVRDSRARIAAAHLSERRRLERNLHDGAQQRLLALGMQLRAAQVNGGSDRIMAALSDGVDELQAAVVELRELANGLHPAVLSEHGLCEALEDLATRFPIELDVGRLHHRYTPEVEAAAWFVVCEAVSNAVKHAEATRIVVRLSDEPESLHFMVADDGTGGADEKGSGLRGLADRVEAAGGSLTVRSGPRGTTVAGVLPCGS